MDMEPQAGDLPFVLVRSCVMALGEQAEMTFVFNHKISWKGSWDLGAMQSSLICVANIKQVTSVLAFLTAWNTLPLGLSHNQSFITKISPRMCHFLKGNFLSLYLKQPPCPGTLCHVPSFTFFLALKLNFFFCFRFVPFILLLSFLEPKFSSLRARLLSVSSQL